MSTQYRIKRGSLANRRRNLDMLLPAVLLVFATLLGGGSRWDVPQLVLLRPAAVLVAMFALYKMDWTQSGRFRPLFLVVILLAGWNALQLVPLPPFLWHNLPGHDSIIAIDKLLGMDSIWRPISMAPNRGWNALAGWIVPIAAILVWMAYPGLNPRNMRLMLIGSALANALLAIAQLSFGTDALYTFEITNNGKAVGLFANVNHSAAYSAVMLIVVAYDMLIADASDQRNKQTPFAIFYPVAGLVIMMHLLVSGSRAGLFQVLPIFLTIALLLRFRPQGTKRQARVARAPSRSQSRYGRPGARARPTMPQFTLPPALAKHANRLLAALALSVPAIMFALFYWANRVPAISRVAEESSFDDLRWKLVGTIQEMISTYWIFGSGFGSFQDVYHIFEKPELLTASYVNQAHNDWAQFIIEGGLPAVLILIFGAIALVRALLARGEDDKLFVVRLIQWSGIIIVVSFASLVDYPLRTPLFQLAMVWLIAGLLSEKYNTGARLTLWPFREKGFAFSGHSPNEDRG